RHHDVSICVGRSVGIRVLSYHRITRRDRFILAATLSFSIGNLIVPSIVTHFFDGPYVEEWDNPPKPTRSRLTKFASSVFGRVTIKMALSPLHLLPLVGIVISAWLRALGTGRHLHRNYFKAKKMTEDQIAVFIEERKWDYRAFGFAAALLEGLPLVGLLFTVSNRIGAAMWAHDLEKRQHYVAQMKAQRATVPHSLVD
ncbi:uncharacterized protein PHACADRAFT_200188, partial [Phanerochaete carnosa HHB-10118-sp]